MKIGEIMQIDRNILGIREERRPTSNDGRTNIKENSKLGRRSENKNVGWMGKRLETCVGRRSL